MSNMQPAGYSQGMVTLNSLFQKGVTAEANATFVPTWDLFSNPQGLFQAQAKVDGVENTLREPDGIHFSSAGEDVVATYILREIGRIYHVSVAPIDPAVITAWS
jgi:hypothetical protein